MAKKNKSDSFISEDIQKSLLSHLSEELTIAERNHEKIIEDFNAYYDMIHSVRENKVNDWESDIFLPEFSSRLLTQVGNFVSQYFGSTDFIEADIDSDDPKDIAESKAAKKLLNLILNDKDTYYYQKIVRLVLFVFTCGYGIVKGKYKQSVVNELSHYEQKSNYATDEIGQILAEDGTPYIDPTIQRPSFQTIEEPVYTSRIETDKPDFDVYPVQHVKMSPEYTYSLNDKEYIIFETEQTLDQLKIAASDMEYFNLDLLDKEEPEGKRGETTYNKGTDNEEQPKPTQKTFIIYERWGKYPVIEKDGAYLPGLDKQGKFLKDAVNLECVIHTAKNREGDELSQIIGFRKSRHTRRPMVRFLCYVDMLKDNGFGDGEMNREIQKAINDNYNLMNYRTKLSITPAFKGKKFAVSENVRISPEKAILLENLDDLQEFQIQDNIQGGIVHQNLLSSRMDYVMATSPQTMGMTPDRAETATMASIVNDRSNVRIGMKSMNLEFIGFTEFYDMLLTLCNDFMLPDTLEELIGKELAEAYNPKRRDKFKPVSQALESETTKAYKMKTWQGILGMVSSIQNPKTPMVVNYVIGQMLEVMGKNFAHFKKFMFEEDPVTMLLYQLATGSKGGQGSPPMNDIGAPPQNQLGMPQQPMEQQVRGMTNEG
jgi:hypothetical protein